ncbi:MAG: hypothetical protein FWG42_10130 [Clostridiales bacterium]|nr:hypothetical protein [Clostridiales bacterium]
MLNMIKGETFRIMHKKSMYVYFGSLAAGYFLVAFIRSGGFDEHSIASDAFNFFNFLPALAGGFLFAAIYADDLNAKTLTTLVGFGIGKAKIVLVKLILTAMFGAAAFALAPLLLYAAHAALGWPAAASTMTTVYAVSLKYLLITLGYSTLSGIAVYGLQHPTFAMVLFILLALNVISGLASVLLANLAGADLAHVFTSRMLSGITDRILSGVIGDSQLFLPITEYAAYLTISAAASIAAFERKEMEF